MSSTRQSKNDFIPEAWGWKTEFLASWAALIESNPLVRGLVPARVTGKERHLYELVCPDLGGRPGFESIPANPYPYGRFGDARVSGRFEYGATGAVDYPAIGDWVLAEIDGDSARILAVLARRSVLSRGSAGPKCDEQALAANIDVAFLVFALDGGRNFLLRFLERALVVANNSGASCCLVLNTSDLAPEDERERALAEARRAAPGVFVVALSAKTGEGVDALASVLAPGETGCVLGKSGVGKSALINALSRIGNPAKATAPGAEATTAREGHVRADDLRGRHTTTSSRLYRLDSGILMIDSPGIRELKLWGDVDALSGGFPEIAELASQCRFADCAHGDEPGCAVRAALESGSLDAARYEAYRNLAREQAWIERRSDDRARRENDQKWKRISKLQKELKKNR